MNDRPTLNNVSWETSCAKKGLSSLVNEDVFQLNKFEEPINQTSAKPKERLVLWLKDILFQLFRTKDNTSRELGKTQADLVNWVEDGTSQLNRGIKNIKNNVRKKAFRYPWVVGISIMLAVGFLMIRLIKPTRKVLKVLK